MTDETLPAEAASTAPSSISEEQFLNWKLHEDNDGVLWLGVDKHQASANVLSRDVLIEAEHILSKLEVNPPRGVVIYSAKESGFIAGADVNEFATLSTPEEAYEEVKRAHALLDRLENLPCPTVAMIGGFALGGGLELALACDYRVMVRDPKLTLGFPEVQLGIHPGFGGTVRSVRKVGVLAAMSMMLSGRNVRYKEALKTGLIDQAVPTRHLARAAKIMAVKPPKIRPRKLTHRLMDVAPVRAAIARMLTAQVAKKAKASHFPAPYAIIELWRKYGGDDKQTMLDQEARSISALVCGKTSRNLVHVFQLQEQLKSLEGDASFEAKRVHVIGAGIMGGDIAAWCAGRGATVTLQDRAPQYIAPAMGRAHKSFNKRYKATRAVQEVMDRLIPDVDGNGVEQADVIIEAIFENVEAKQALYAQIEPRMKPDAILATNTSSIRLEALTEGMTRPDRLIGLHFFNPVAMLPLVEVIGGADTDPKMLARGRSFVHAISKLPLPCSSAPGFVVNRVLMPYLMEAFIAGSEGIPLEVIDKAATNFGMPMGPVELADTVGLDVCLSVSRVFAEEFSLQVPDRLVSMVEQKTLGRKTGAGFYQWRKGKAVKKKVGDDVPDGLTDRLIMPMLNEAVACLREQVVADADLLDAGVIFGTGFAPFTGGPLRYAKTRGVDNVLGSLKALEGEHGERFTPDAGWVGLQ